MVDGFILRILLQGLTLFWLGPACEASSLGMTVHVVPQNSDGGRTVQAHFTVIAPNPCPTLSGLCAEGEDCVTYPSSLPFTGTKPNSGWCVRQWQKKIPSNYNDKVNLGPSVEFYVSLRAGPKIRANTGRLNRPPFIALPPPIRARVNCPHHIHLSVKDLDGDKVRCRFARGDQGECLNCSPHSFIELNEETCILSFTGQATVGQYSIYLMAEDIVPVPIMSYVAKNSPLSAIPVHLSLTVEEASFSCIAEPVAAGQTPQEDQTLFVLPYDQVDLTVQFISDLESILEVAVVGPPELFRSELRSMSSLAVLSIAWVHHVNQLTHLLPICFVANTNSLQSESRCVWLYQREMRTLPDGTELNCDNKQMTLFLPVATLTNINLDELQLNSPTCPVTYNTTYLTARIPLNGCGTKTVHSGSEIIYTNTLQSVRPYTVVSRQVSLILPLACRIPGVQAKGPQYKLTIPTETEIFGAVRFWIEVHPPGKGPLAKYTRNPEVHRIRSLSKKFRRDVDSSQSGVHSDSISSTSTNSTGSGSTQGTGSKTDILDLHVMSNCTTARAELIVSNCWESETEDFAVSQLVLEQGCSASNSSIEIITSPNNTKVYRLHLGTMGLKGTTMFMECTVNLCIATMPSKKCPDLCSSSYLRSTNLVPSVFTRSYTVRSGAITLVTNTSTTITVAATDTTTITTATATITTTPTTTSHAPEEASAIAVGVILVSISIFLHNAFLC